MISAPLSVLKYSRIILLMLVLAASLTFPAAALAQTDAARLADLEERVSRLERSSPIVHSDQSVGVALFVCAAFCALWAQQTRRSPWLWFFLGLFFHVITLLVLLAKNSNDRRDRATKDGLDA